MSRREPDRLRRLGPLWERARKRCDRRAEFDGDAGRPALRDFVVSVHSRREALARS